MLWSAALAVAGDYYSDLSGPDVSADTTLYSLGPSDGGEVETLFVSSTTAQTLRTLISFPTAVGGTYPSVPPGSTVHSATLTFTAVASAGVDRVQVYALNEAWDEALATWTQASDSRDWTSAGAGGSSHARECGAVTGTDSTVVIDVRECLAEWAAGSENHGWVLTMSGTGTETLVLYSSESASPPELRVAFTAPDADGDGDDIWVDCDDTEASANNHAIEVPCDGIDNDCTAATPDCEDTGDSGGPDDGVDIDRDRFSVSDGDCDDADSTVYPGHHDDCDTIDNDCDGEIDEDCADAAGFGDGCSCGEGAAKAALLLPVYGLTRRRRVSLRALRSPSAPS